jgi:DnaK suppressor protein
MTRAKKPPLDDQPHPETGLTPSQLRSLKQSLEQHKEQLLARFRDHVSTAIQEDGGADEMDCASRDQEQAYLLRLADKERKLLQEVVDALARIQSDTYGLCEGSGEPIGFRRLEARPWARYSIAYKEMLEHEERGRAR